MPPSTPFPDYPTLHLCPMYIAQLIDPTIRSWHLGPGFCTRDNLFGVGYLVLLAVNYVLAILAFYAIFAVLGRLVCWRGFARKGTRTEDRKIGKGWEVRSSDRAERGEGGWVGKHIKAFRPILSPVREKEKI